MAKGEVLKQRLQLAAVENADEFNATQLATVVHAFGAAPSAVTEALCFAKRPL